MCLILALHTWYFKVVLHDWPTFCSIEMSHQNLVCYIVRIEQLLLPWTVEEIVCECVCKEK